MTARVAINGLGRVGRHVVRAIRQQQPAAMEIAAIGLVDLADAPAAIHLLKHDSNYGRFGADVALEQGDLRLDGARVRLVDASSLDDLPWAEMGVELVIDATGAHGAGREAEAHLRCGARKVVIASACDEADFTMILGLNEGAYDAAHHHLVAVDTATTNALAVVLAPLADAFDVRGVLVSAVRAYGSDQMLLDAVAGDLRRARSAPQSIVPTISRSATSVGRFVPPVAGKVAGLAVRVPVPVVSMLELTMHLGEPVSAERLNACLSDAAAGPLGRVLGTSRAPLVSSDYRGSRYSAVVDLPLTIAIGPLAKVGAWYDNEWAYACRIADVAAVVATAG